MFLWKDCSPAADRRRDSEGLSPESKAKPGPWHRRKPIHDPSRLWTGNESLATNGLVKGVGEGMDLGIQPRNIRIQTTEFSRS